MSSNNGMAKSFGSKLLTYTILITTGIIILIPFLLALSGSFKTVSDVYTYPPRFLPHAADTALINDVEYPLFLVPVSETETLELARIEQGVTVRLWSPLAGGESFLAPVAGYTETEEFVTIDGQELAVFTDSSGEKFAEVDSSIVGVYVDPADPNGEKTYFPSADLEASETIKAELGNFGEVVELNGFGRALTNTVLVTILVVAGQLFTSILGGYAFARLRFNGRDKLFLVWLGSIMVPFVVILIPLFQLIVGINWVNNLGALIIPFIFSAYGTFLMRQFFISIPFELEEAARIDGASRWTILWKIFVPLSIPAIATLTTFAFLYAWNSFIWPLIVINTGNESASVLAPTLSVLGGRGADAPNLVLAGVILAILPPILVFLFAQRAFVENAQSSGLKG
jgi:ABC-type glycerol-3-phosphate transport system permease component